MKAKTRKILIIAGAVVIALISIRLMFTRNTLPFGAFLLGAMALAYLIWRAFVKNSKEELRQSARRENMLSEQITSLKNTIDLLNRELEEKSSSPSIKAAAASKRSLRLKNRRVLPPPCLLSTLRSHIACPAIAVSSASCRSSAVARNV